MISLEGEKMKEAFPEIMVDFIESLQTEFEFALKEKKTGAFGDPQLTFSCPPFSICIYGECREVWCIEISHESLPNEWYDTALSREIITNKIDSDLMTLEEKISFWKTNLTEVKRLFHKDESSVHIEFKRRRVDRARRMFPKLYE